MSYLDLFDFSNEGTPADDTPLIQLAQNDEETEPLPRKAEKPASELAQAIVTTANKIGINPEDLATAISYETGGTFDKLAPGPTTQWGRHRGLIQWGEPQAKQYGVTQDSSVTDQLDAVGRYLVDRGVKPGMGMLDVYSAINAGRVGKYDASDANNGGAPGTVRDKVASMAKHRKNAVALLAGLMTPSETSPANSTVPVRGVPGPTSLP